MSGADVRPVLVGGDESTRGADSLLTGVAVAARTSRASAGALVLLGVFLRIAVGVPAPRRP